MIMWFPPARRLGNIFTPLTLVPTSETYISDSAMAMKADVDMDLFGPINL